MSLVPHTNRPNNLLSTESDREQERSNVRESTKNKYYLYRIDIWITLHSTYQTSTEVSVRVRERVNVVFRGNFGPQIRRMRLKKKVQIEYSMYQLIHVYKLGTSRELLLLWFVVDCWQTKKIYNIEKMTTLTVCNRIESGKSEKVKLNSINFKSSVQNLKDGISKRIKRPVSDFGE